MGDADVEHDADAGPGDLAEVGQVSESARTHFHHEKPRALVGPQNGVRQSELVVEGAQGCDRRAEPTEQLAEDVLGRCLTRRPGHGHDRQVGQPADDRPSDPAHGVERVVDHHGGRIGGSRAQHRHGAGRHRVGGEVVAVDIGSSERDE